MKEKIAQIISTVLNKNFTDYGKINKEEIGSWDSLKHMEIIMTLEDEFDVVFSPEDIPAMDSLEHIAKKIEELKK